MLKFLQRRRHRERVNKLFSIDNFPIAVTWCSRGSPYLWHAMQREFLKRPWAKSLTEFEQNLAEVFYQLTQHSLYENEFFYCESFAHGGMSSGMISTEHWRMHLIEVLKFRFRRLAEQQA